MHKFKHIFEVGLKSKKVWDFIFVDIQHVTHFWRICKSIFLFNGLSNNQEKKLKILISFLQLYIAKKISHQFANFLDKLIKFCFYCLSKHNLCNSINRKWVNLGDFVLQVKSMLCSSPVQSGRWEELFSLLAPYWDTTYFPWTGLSQFL